MQIAQVLSGFSLGNADLLRRAMGKKIKAEMDAQRNIFVDGAKARGVDGAQAAQIFEQVNKFAGYGFNKSHAAAYALVAYQTAWLKANYPVEFLAASMTLDMGNTDKLKVFKDEIRKLEIDLLPPNINESFGMFSVRQPVAGEEKGAIRYALAAVKNVGAQAMDALVEERQANGPFQDIWDFAERVGSKVANKRQLENLIRAGAFECLDINRRKLMEGVDIILKTANAAEREREDNQVNLFGGDSGLKIVQQQALPEVDDWPKIERLNEEVSAVGFYLSAHPLDSYGSTLERLGVVPFSSLTAASAGSRPKLAGVVEEKRERTSAKGNRFAFVKFSGRDGIFEVVMFSEVLTASRELLDSSRPLLVACEVRVDGGEIKLNAVGVSDLDQAVARSGAGLKVRLDSEDSLEALKRALDGGKQGRGQVRLVLNIDRQQSVELALPGSYLISADMRSAVESVPGVLELRDI